MQLDRTAIIIALIVGAPATISSLGALVVILRTSDKVLVVEKKIEEVRHSTNSMKDALVAVTRSDALQEGHTAGVQDEKDRKGAATKEVRK